MLHDFNLHIQPGERVALVGQTGAGKSTIVSLLMRFYDVTGGRIRVDGHDIRDVTHAARCGARSASCCRSRSCSPARIAHNIRYARPDATDDEVEAAARAVGAARVDHAACRSGYDTLVNERGVGLSIGQRQLISFARVLIADPRILILDEATASLDTAHRARRPEGDPRGSRRAAPSFIIAHRLSTIRDADRIIVLEHGRIVEQGTHDELIAQRGVYYRLYSLGFQDTAAATATAAPGNGNAGVVPPGGLVRPSQAGA